MSLTLPTAYSNSSKLGNIQENWFAQLFHEDSYLSFDGTDDSVNLGATTGASAMSLDNSDNLSVAFWINFPTAGATEWIFANNSQVSDYSGVFIYKDSNDKISIGWGDGSGTGSGDRETMLGSTALAINTWYFITITTDFTLTTTNTVIRVNNSAETVSNGGTSGATDPVYESGIAYFGRTKNVYGEFKIRNFGIWAGELDSNNLTALYNSGNYFSFSEDSGDYNQSSVLKGYWTFNNGETTIQDKTGNGANGVLSGGVYGDFLPISLTDTTVGSVFYHGAITNKPAIRTSIDLANSTAKTGNVSLNVVNFNYKGDDFSAELFLGTRKYINRNVKIYSQLNGDTTLANCLQIYQGRLIDISHDDSSVSLQITEQRPWDFITIPLPDSKTTSNNIPIPVSYGAFTKNSATTFASPLFASELTAKTYRPVPFNKTNDEQSLYVDGVSSVSNSELAHYEKGVDVFVPFENGVSGTSSTDGADHAKIEPLQIRAFKQRADTYEAITNATVTVANIGDSINADDTDAATFSVNMVSANDTNTVIYDFKVVNPSGMKSSYFVMAKESDGDNVSAAEAIDTSETGINVSDASNLTAYDVIRIDNEEMNITSISSNTLTVQRGFNGTSAVAHDNASAILVDNTINVVGIKYGITIATLSGDLSNVKLFISTDGNYYTETKTSTLSTITRSMNLSKGTNNIRIKITFTADDTSTAGSLNATFSLYDVFFLTQRISEEPEDIVFTGNDGLTASWDSGAISHGHEAHRDLLIRFAGYTTTAPANWSALDTDRAIPNWKIRWWELEPVALKKVLERLQYEFGFIFKFRADGTGSYVHILQTSELSATQTFTKEDIKNLKINNSSFSDLLTKMEINYEKHPAENRHLSSVTSSNSTARSDWNIQAKENIKEVNLDMNVGTPNTSGQTDGNADFYSYYDNIFGDIKKIINCDIINSAKGYNLETGDIVQFSNTAGEMPVEPFGDNWADFYMITNLNRSLGKVSITAREVG